MFPKRILSREKGRPHFFLVIAAGIMSSCVAPRSFYHEDIEPVLSPKVSKAQLNVSYRLLTKVSVAATYAPTKSLALRATGGYGIGYAAAGFSSLFFLGNDKRSFIVGLDLSYQLRQRIKNSQIFILDIQKYNINCRYFSGGLVSGIHFSTGKTQHQITVKANYNKVLNYDYVYRHAENSGKDIAVTFDNEKLHESIPAFFSGDLNYCFLNPIGKHFFFKFQLGLQVLQKTAVHNYVFDSQPEMSGDNMKTATRLHPLGNPMSTSVGLIFYLPR